MQVDEVFPGFVTQHVTLDRWVLIPVRSSSIGKIFPRHFIYRERRLGRLFPGKLFRLPQACTDQTLTQVMFGCHSNYRFYELLAAERIEELRRVIECLQQRWYAAGNDRRTTRHRHEWWQPKAFID
jgi:hypothetical protein